MKDKIVGGEVAVDGWWPWQIAYQRTLNESARFNAQCGGTILTRDWIVTAAHCLGAEDNENLILRITVGGHIRNDMSRRTQFVKAVERHMTNYLFNISPVFNDILLVKVTPIIRYNDYVMPACLPFGDSIEENMTDCWVTGFGNTVQEGCCVSKVSSKWFKNDEDPKGLPGNDLNTVEDEELTDGLYNYLMKCCQEL
ncbi:ACRO protein, partial [Polypterus senegalus]